MKKKLIIKLAVIVLLLGLPAMILLSNTKDAEANTCSKEVDYYFIKGIKMSDQSTGTVDAYDETTFELPNDWGNSVSIKNVDISYSWTADDANTYFANQKASGCTTGASTAWCDPSDTECLNSGNGQDYVWEDCSEISVDSSGNATIGGSSASDFVNNYTIGANQTGTNIDFSTNGKEITATVDRNWTQDASEFDGNYYNGEWKYQPLKVTVTYDGVPCEEEEEEPNQCSINSGTISDSASGCGGHGYSATYNKGYSANFNSSQTIANACSDVKISASAVVTFNESGSLSASVNPREQYAGGGFAFNLGYSGSASWNYCKTSTQTEDINCSCSVKKLERELVNLGCKQDENFKCLKDKNGMTIYEYGWVEECVPSSCSCTDADKATAKSIIEGQVNSEFGGPSANPSVLSQDSNNEKDTAVNKSEIGTATASGGGTSSSVTFTQSHACINLREVVKDGVTYPAYVTYKDTCETTSPDGYAGEKDGGYKYYIPLKYEDGKEFFVKANSNGKINVLNNVNWTFNLTCSVDVKQKLYDTPTGLKYIYRPIDMLDPFPKTINSDREIGSNWVNFMEDEDAQEDKLNRNTTGLEYSATLTPDILNNIKTYNNTTIYPGLKTINNSGRSQLLLNNGILNVVERKLGTTYNSLGECTEECW